MPPISDPEKEKDARYWNGAFRSGKLKHLHRDAEQSRLKLIASMVADAAERYGPVTLVDIGCGEGLLLAHLMPAAIAEYVAVDFSRIALQKIPQSEIPVQKIESSLAALETVPARTGPVVLVASEVLYYDENGVNYLQRLARTRDCREVIISCVAGRPDKPNWEAASTTLWAELSDTDLQSIDTKIVRDGGLKWDIVRYRAD